MGVEVDWVRQEPTGRLIFRRRYPPDVQRATGKWELKVPLGAKWRLTEAASRLYYQACDRFDREVREARAAIRVKAKEQSATFDRINPGDIEHLAGVLIHEQRTGMEQRLQQGHGRLAGEAWAWLLPQLREMRLSGDTALLEDALGPTLDGLLASEGLRIDPANRDSRISLLWALNAKLVSAGDDIDRHLQGYAPPIPARPQRPANPRGGKRTVAALIKAYKAAKWDGWSQSSRTAVEPAFRALQDTVGDKLVTEVDRETAREVFELVKALPAALGRNKDLKGLPVPEAVRRGKEMGLPTIGPKTVNGSYMAHISAAFGWAVNEDWIPKNHFVRLSAHDPVAEQDKRDPFTADQLRALFTKAPWDAPSLHDIDRPGAYWLPLIALFMGARLGEIAGLRIMDATELEGVASIRIRPYEGHTIKNDGSRRDLPIHSALVRLGLLEFIAHRRKVAKAGDLLFPDGKANVRSQWGAKLSERFGQHLKAFGFVGKRLSFHSFRHNWEDRLRAAGVHGTSLGKALGGRKVEGSEAAYGQGFTIGDLQGGMEKVGYPGLDLSHLEPPR